MMLEVNGVEYENFESAEVTLLLDALSNTFTFTTTNPGGAALPFRGGEKCSVYVDGEKVLTGFIEQLELRYNTQEHTIRVSGRDKTCDLVDGTLGAINDIRGQNLTLKALIEKIITHLGLDILVVDEVSPPEFNGSEDIAAPEPGENAFEFIQKYAKKRQVLLTSNAEGNVVITRNTGVQGAGVVQHLVQAEDNNVLQSTFSFNHTARFNRYEVLSSQNPTALNEAGDVPVGSVVEQGGEQVDGEVRTGRQLVIVPDTELSTTQCKERAKWEADVRRARSLPYNCTVPFYRVGGNTQNPGALWSINTVYQIVDDFVGKIEPMLCNQITFSLSLDQGRITELGFVGQKAYTVFLENSTVASEASNVL